MFYPIFFSSGNWFHEICAYYKQEWRQSEKLKAKMFFCRLTFSNLGVRISHLYPFWNGGKIPQSDSMRSGYYTAAKAAKGRREVFSLRRSFFKGGSTTFSKSLSFSSQHANLSFANEKRKIITTIVIKIRLFQRP